MKVVWRLVGLFLDLADLVRVRITFVQFAVEGRILQKTILFESTEYTEYTENRNFQCVLCVPWSL